MTTETLKQETRVTPPARKPWETPAIVLERSLEASAQGGPPVGPNGFLGPLSTSGGSGQCK